MHELKAGVGLVFDTFAGKLYLVLILLAWIFVMFLASIVEFDKSFLSFWFFYMMVWPVSSAASQLGNSYKSILSCGGLYCVPRLAIGMRRFSIIAGFALAFMFTSPWFLVKNLTLQDRCICIGMFFTLLAAWLLCRSIPWSTMKINFLSSIIWVLWFALFVRILFYFYFGVSFLKGWQLILPAGIVLCVYYCVPYKATQIQKAHRQIAILLMNIDETTQKIKMKITPAVERLVIGRMSRRSQKVRYLWGAICPSAGALLSCGKKMLLLAAALAIFSCFLPFPSLIAIVFAFMMIIISMIGAYTKLPVHSQMLIAGGRRERFYGTITAAAGFSIAVGLVVVLSAVITRLAAPFIPPFVIRGHQIVFTPFSLYPAFLAMGIIPALFGISLCLERAPWATTAIVIMISFPAIGLLFSLGEMVIEFTGPIPTAIFIILCWVFLIMTARIICYKKDLILQADRI